MCEVYKYWGVCVCVCVCDEYTHHMCEGREWEQETAHTPWHSLKTSPLSQWEFFEDKINFLV